MQVPPAIWRIAILLSAILALTSGAFLFSNAAGVIVAAPEQPEETFAIYLPKVYFGDPWTAPFGVESTSPLWVGSVVTTQTVETRGGWVRYGWQISWQDMQPLENDPIDWSYLTNFEKELRDMRYSGTRPVVIIKDSPHWALDPTSVDKDGNPTSCGLIAPDRYDDFAAFVTQVVNRYKTEEFNVHDWEIGNEPDVDPTLVPQDYIFGCWGDIDDTSYYGGDKFGQMLIVVSQAIKAADPSARVWVGGLLLATPNTTDPSLGKPENFLRGILAAGAGPYIDVVPYHWHPSYWNVTADYDYDVDDTNPLDGPWNALGGGIRGKARYLRQIMTDYGVNIPVFLNESGFGCISITDRPDVTWCDPPDTLFFENQAYYIVRTYVRGLSENVMGMIWYSITGPGWRNTGMLDSFQQPRLVYHAYKHLVQRLGSLSYQSPVDYGTGIEAYSFSRLSQRTDVLWASLPSGSFTVDIPVAAFIDAYDIFGNKINIQPIGDNYPVPVGFSPVYILRTP